MVANRKNSVSPKESAVKLDGYEMLADASPRDSVWDTHKRDAAYAGWVFKREETPEKFHKRGQRMTDCAEQLVFGRGHNEDGEVTWRLEDARFCRVRNCPICQWRRTLLWKAKFFKSIPKLQESAPKARWIFATFTTKNCEVTDLRSTVQAMNKAWDRIRKTVLFNNVLGWVRTVEVTRNPISGTAHPHFHVLFMVKTTYFKGTNYKTSEDWAEGWQAAMRLDYLPVVDVRAVRSKSTGKVAKNSDVESLSGAVAEVIKYVAKPSDLFQNLDWFIEFCQQVHRLRFVATGGLLKDVFKEEEKSEDLLLRDEESEEAEEQQEEKILARFNYIGKVKAYARKRSGDGGSDNC